MIKYKRILVVSRMIQSCKLAIQHGVSLAQKYDAELFVIHSIYNPFGLKGWSMGTLSIEKEYAKILLDTKEKLSELVEAEKTNGMSITELVREGEPTEEILKAIKEKKIDLLVMLAHEEGRFEHLIFNLSNNDLVRKMPCSIMLIKKEPEPILDDVVDRDNHN
jgi:nucleotide-binding universal stress UspA family protein